MHKPEISPSRLWKQGHRVQGGKGVMVLWGNGCIFMQIKLSTSSLGVAFRIVYEKSAWVCLGLFSMIKFSW